MANPLSDLAAGGISGIADAFAKIVAVFKLTPEQKATIEAAAAANQEKMAELDLQYKIKIIDANVAMNETAGQNIRAEAASGKYAADARPSVIYAGLVVILINYGALALLPRRWGYVPLTIPDIVWEIWCVCVTGYVFARSSDKVFGGQGGSAQLPFGIKIDSKGDK